MHDRDLCRTATFRQLPKDAFVFEFVDCHYVWYYNGISSHFYNQNGSDITTNSDTGSKASLFIITISILMLIRHVSEIL